MSNTISDGNASWFDGCCLQTTGTNPRYPDFPGAVGSPPMRHAMSVSHFANFDGRPERSAADTRAFWRTRRLAHWWQIARTCADASKQPPP